jgi:CBS domain-containing protein
MADTASDIMTRNVVSVKPTDDTSSIAAVLAKHEISAAPVVDDDGKLLGIVSEGDLMKPFSKQTMARRAWWLGILAEGERLAPEFLDYISVNHHSAADLMTRNVVTAEETTPVPEIADLLILHKIKRVPILKDGRVVGIVSRADIVRAMQQLQNIGRQNLSQQNLGQME